MIIFTMGVWVTMSLTNLLNRVGSFLLIGFLFGEFIWIQLLGRIDGRDQASSSGGNSSSAASGRGVRPCSQAYPANFSSSRRLCSSP